MQKHESTKDKDKAAASAAVKALFGDKPTVSNPMKKPGADGRGPAFPKSADNPGGFPAPNDTRARRMKGTDRKATGRKDSEGQEANIDLAPLREKTSKGVEHHKHVAAVGADYSAFCKDLAEETGLNTGAIRKFFAAKAGDKAKLELAKRNAGQLALIFEEMSK